MVGGSSSVEESVGPQGQATLRGIGTARRNPSTEGVDDFQRACRCDLEYGAGDIADVEAATRRRAVQRSGRAHV